MEPEENRKGAPRFTFWLELDPALQRAVTSGDPLNQAVQNQLVQALSELMGTLGIPGKPVVRVTALDGPLFGGRFMRVSAEDQSLRYSDESVQLVHCWANGSIFKADVTPAEILAWLEKCSKSPTDSDRQTVVKFLTEMSVEIIKSQPAVLLGQTQLQAYRESLPAPSSKASGQWNPDDVSWRPILSHLLNLRISIADKQAVTDVLAEHVGAPWPETCEALIEVLRPNAIEVRLREEYLRQLTTIDEINRVGLLDFSRNGMFAELGIAYPQFHLVPDDQLGPKEFMFKLNHLTCGRQIGLGPEECLVNDTPARLKGLGIPANSAGNPASGLPQSITNLEYKRGLEAQGFTTWDQMGYLILSLANVLRRNAAVFVHRGFIESQFEQLETIFPALVQAARSVVLPEQVAAVLRGLLGEELSIQNLRLILERLCDFSLRNDPGSQLVLDGEYLAAGQTGRGNDLTQLIEFVRAGMKREISGKYSKETNTLTAYLLEYGIEVLMSPIGSVDADTRLDSELGKQEQDKIVESIRKEIGYLPPTAALPVILTTRDARVALRKAIAQDFPRLRVVAYQELMPDLNVQPVARIACEFPEPKT